MAESVRASKYFYFKLRNMTSKLFPLLLFLFIPVTFVLSDNNDDFRSSYFFSKNFHVKEGEPMKTTEVVDVQSCKLLCVRKPLCYSVNFKRSPEPKSKLHRCELFNLSSSGKIPPSQHFDIYKKIAGKLKVGDWSQSTTICVRASYLD